MTDKLHDGLTRRELFLAGNVLAMPVLLRRERPRGNALAMPVLLERCESRRGGGTADARAADLPVDRRRTDHQLPRDVHDHRRVGGASRGPRRDGCSLAATSCRWTNWPTRVGQRLAELTGAEWGMVSAGCAAGLKHVTAACVTGGNPEKLTRIPDLTGFDKTEVIIPQSSRNVYDARRAQHRRHRHHGEHTRGARAGASIRARR